MSKLNMSFINEMVKTTDNENAGLASNEEKFNRRSFIDTGSYSLNALISGTIYGGIADDRVLGLAGEEATGKTFFALAAIQSFLRDNPTGVVFYFESENAIDTDTFRSRGIDPNRVAIIPVATVEEFRTQAARILDNYKKKDEDERPPLLLTLDSLGNTSTLKEIQDIEEGNNKRDMTKQQLIRGAFRTLTLKMGLVHVPIIVTNHIYEKTGVSFGDPRVISGGGGLKYAASTIVMLSKAQYKVGGELRGAKITATLNKSRFTKEKLKCHVLLHHESGLDRYYGLVDIAISAGIFIKKGKKIFTSEDDKKGVFESAIDKNPEAFFTEDVLKRIDMWVGQNWRYGSDRHPEEEDEEKEEE